MNGLPLVFGSTALLASFALRKKGSRGWMVTDGDGGHPPRPYHIPESTDHPALQITSKMFSYAPIDIAAIRETEIPEPHFYGEEAVVQGPITVNGIFHHLMAIRVWDGTEATPETLKEFFPDVPLPLRRLVTGASIRESALSPAEREWLDTARQEEQVAIRDPHDRLGTQARAAYGDQIYLESTEIPGFPGRWVIIMFPQGD
ncbi:hypothetical protein CMI47_00765 [Candidatus Pacearchaeota archaeon]|nr:hypothetical protein [Candidatus Pacearchaeota archaeon]|tara:strand:- start:690 stop:1295 length:606 start_codon:yes stop_codon:yes gene_type:complete